MKRIGITGNIGSGKSIVCKVFKLLGVPVFNADESARAIMTTPEVIRGIVSLFGEGIADRIHGVDRKKLAAIVFGDKAALAAINALIHPLVRADFEKWCRKQEGPYCLFESAILFESGLHTHFDGIILVKAPTVLRMQRVIDRDGLSAEEVKKRMNNQLPQESLKDKADFIICNDERSLLLTQVLDIDKKIRTA